MGVESFVNGLVKWFVGTAQFALRRFVMYSMILFFLGMYVGARLFQTQSLETAWTVIFAPLVLAFLAYLYTEIAAIIFILLLLVGLLLLL